jgi:hypothetical protein
MENLRTVKWHGDSFAFGILVDHVAAALANNGKFELFEHRADFREQ